MLAAELRSLGANPGSAVPGWMALVASLWLKRLSIKYTLLYYNAY